MKRYTEPEMEVVSFEIKDVTNNGSKFDDGENPVSTPEGFFGDSVNL